MMDVLVKEQVFQHGIDKVWRAISRGEEISKWFIKADFKPEVGYAYTFTATEEHGSTQIKGTVLEATPYNLKYTWKVGDAPVETIVLWHLEDLGGQTKLTLEHSGIAKFGGETAVEMFEHFGKGWDACFATLKTYVNDEETAPAH